MKEYSIKKKMKIDREIYHRNWYYMIYLFVNIKDLGKE